MAVVVVVLVVVIGLYAAGIFNTSSSSGSGGGGVTVTVTAVNIAFSGPSNCWTSATGTGFTLSGGQQDTVSDQLSYTKGLFDPSSCTVTSVSIASPGFSLVTANTPLVVTSGGSQTLSVTVTAPTTTYTGVLTIDAVDTSP